LSNTIGLTVKRHRSCGSHPRKKIYNRIRTQTQKSWHSN
jgi:hypothetical protein